MGAACHPYTLRIFLIPAGSSFPIENRPNFYAVSALIIDFWYVHHLAALRLPHKAYKLKGLTLKFPKKLHSDNSIERISSAL